MIAPAVISSKVKIENGWFREGNCLIKLDSIIGFSFVKDGVWVQYGGFQTPISNEAYAVIKERIGPLPS